MIFVNNSQDVFLDSVRYFIKALFGEDRNQSQILSGHPWWVRPSSDNRPLSQLHLRFLTEKVLATFEEASAPENSRKAYVACLNQISPAEMDCFFNEAAYQLPHGEIMRIGDTHFSKPMKFPENLWLIGVIDHSMLHLDSSLIDGAFIFHTPVFQPAYNLSISKKEQRQFQKVFLGSYIRDKQKAFHKLQSILQEHKISLQPFFQVVQYLKDYNTYLTPRILDDAVIYISNAWSLQKQGLFDPSPSRNLKIAIDFAIAHVLLPRAEKRYRTSISFRRKLINLLIPFPNSLTYLKNT